MATYHEKGYYNARITNAIIGESRGESKTPQIEISLKLLDVRNKDGSCEEYMVDDKYPPIIYLSITDNTMGHKDAPGWVAQVLEILRFDFANFSPDSLIGWEGVVECRFEKAQFGKKAGQDVEKWSIFQERGASQNQAENNPSVVKDLKNRFGKMFGGSSPAKRQPATATAPTTNGRPDNDIPF